MKVKVLRLVPVEAEINVESISYIITTAERMAKTICDGCFEDLGYENPKASIVDDKGRVHLLCVKCQKKQGISQNKGAL